MVLQALTIAARIYLGCRGGPPIPPPPWPRHGWQPCCPPPARAAAPRAPRAPLRARHAETLRVAALATFLLGRGGGETRGCFDGAF